jgi:single-strand DNA-binding protein
MTDMNHVFLIGHLTKDLGADERSFFYTSGRTACAKTGIAVNRSVKQGDQWTDEVSYFDITIWGKTAENIKQYLMKGKQIAVDGFLKQDRWQKDGQNFSKVTVVANSVQLLGGKSDCGSNNTCSEYRKSGAASNGSIFKPKPAAQQGFEESNEFQEDIPF